MIVDGQPVEMATVKLPKVPHLGFCGVCTTVDMPCGDGEMMRVGPMRGQLAATHFFDAPLPPGKVCRKLFIFSPKSSCFCGIFLDLVGCTSASELLAGHDSVMVTDDVSFDFARRATAEAAETEITPTVQHFFSGMLRW